METKQAEHALRGSDGEYTIFGVYGDGVSIVCAMLYASRYGQGHHERRIRTGSERFVSVEEARQEYKRLRSAGHVVVNL